MTGFGRGNGDVFFAFEDDDDDDKLSRYEGLLTAGGADDDSVLNALRCASFMRFKTSSTNFCARTRLLSSSKSCTETLGLDVVAVFLVSLLPSSSAPCALLLLLLLVEVNLLSI